MRMVEALVSIITPCFNMEKTISRLMDSIIGQTYRPIEFILVDDGSIDNSLSIAESYKSKFKTAGIEYRIYHQENQGLGAAINFGIKKINGEYLCWPDADDYLEPTSVEERVAAFIEHSECAVVTSNAYIRNANEMESAALLVDGGLKKHTDSNQFLYHLNAESIFCSGCHMVKTEKFFEVNPDRCIYPAKRGQNWQMLLPIYFKYPRFFLNKPLYNYVIYPGSMSRGDNNYESFLYRYKEHEEILREVIKKIERVQKADVTEYSRFLDDKYAKLRMELAIKYNKQDVFMSEYKQKQINVGLDLEDVFNYVRNKFRLLDKPLSWVYRGARLLSLRYSRTIKKKINHRLSCKTIR